MPKAALLLYDPTPSPWASKVRQLCAIQGLRFSAVDTAQLDRPIRDLAQDLPDPGSAGEPLPEPLLLLCHLSSPQLDKVLQGLRNAGVPRTCLKAILTPTNAGWTLRALYDELCREREQLS